MQVGLFPGFLTNFIIQSLQGNDADSPRYFTQPVENDTEKHCFVSHHDLACQ